MSEKLNVPEAHQADFNRIMVRAPEELRNDENFVKTILLYLKLGGLKLALQHLKIKATPFCESFSLVKRRPEGANDEDSNDGGDEAKESDDEKEEDNGGKGNKDDD